VLYSEFDERHRPRGDDEPMRELTPDDFLDTDSLISPDTSTSKLLNDATAAVSVVSNLDTAVWSTSQQYVAANFVELPSDFKWETYASRIINPQECNDRPETQEFIEAFPTMATRLERLRECYEPVAYSARPVEPRWAPDSLPPFPTVAMVSEAFKLNFWQHAMFEVAARYLLYAYATDIEVASGESLVLSQSRPAPYDIKPQLIAYLGGQAGTGKSTVVESLLALAREWGRDGSVETLAFNGAAAINIHGKTMHSARKLKLSGAESKGPLSHEMKTLFSRVVMVIVDEISITDQGLLGGTDSVSRSMSSSPEKFMGGEHVMLIGDYLQLPPVGGIPYTFLHIIFTELDLLKSY
jgi:hypothetical protein